MSRIDKINTEVMRELANVIRELKDSRIPVMTSVVSVSVTNDLRYAKAYISIMGSDDEKKAAIKGLQSAAGYVRREIGSRVNIRCVPEFTFCIDTTIEYGARINDLLHSVIKEDESND